MDALKSRKAAIAVFVAVVLVFSLLGFRLSLDRRCRAIEREFFADTLTSPGTQLGECAKYANRILSVIRGQLDDSLYAAVSSSRGALVEALEAQDIAAAASANRALVSAVDAAAQAAEGRSFDTTENFPQLLSDFAGAERVAASSDYNETVERFVKNTAERFPADLLRRIVPVDMPAKFE